MCVAVPARVLQVHDGVRAVVEQGSRTREVSILPVPDVREGDYVLLNLGVAVQKLTQEEAQEVAALWTEIAASLLDGYGLEKEEPENNG